MEQAKSTPNIASVIEGYLESVKLTRSQNTALTYGKALKEFKKILVKEKIDPKNSPSSVLTEDLISKFVIHLKTSAPATEKLYVGAIARFYKYLAAERLAEINWARLELLIKQDTRRLAIRLPQFPTNNIERVLDFVSNITFYEAEPETERLRAARDRAFVLTLADTGLRVHEACNLRLGARS